MALGQVQADQRPQIPPAQQRRGGVELAQERRRVLGLLGHGRAGVGLGALAPAIAAAVVGDDPRLARERLGERRPAQGIVRHPVDQEDRRPRAALVRRQIDAQSPDGRAHRRQPSRAASIHHVEGFGGLFGDPEELQRRMAEFADQMQGAQKIAWADNAIKLAVDLTVAAINRVSLEGDVEHQAEQIRSVMAIVFPEAVTLVREARQGLQ